MPIIGVEPGSVKKGGSPGKVGLRGRLWGSVGRGYLQSGNRVGVKKEELVQ